MVVEGQGRQWGISPRDDSDDRGVLMMRLSWFLALKKVPLPALAYSWSGDQPLFIELIRENCLGQDELYLDGLAKLVR